MNLHTEIIEKLKEIRSVLLEALLFKDAEIIRECCNYSPEYISFMKNK